MPASIFEIMSLDWISKDIINQRMAEACDIANLVFVERNGIFYITYTLGGNDGMTFESKSYEAFENYIIRYPNAPNEPIEFNPYIFLIKDSCNGQLILKSMVTSNSYFNDDILFKFSNAFMELMPKSFIIVNRRNIITYKHLRELRKNILTTNGWFAVEYLDARFIVSIDDICTYE